MKKKLVIVLMLIIIVLVFGLFYFINYVSIKNDKCTLTLHNGVVLSQEKVDKLNHITNPEDALYEEIEEIKDLASGIYGKFFHYSYHFIITRFVKANDYIIEMRPDYSALSEEDAIFCGFYSGGGFRNGDTVFLSDGDGKQANDYITLVGCTYDKTEEEVIELCKKVKIHIWIEDSKGHVKEKVITPTDESIQCVTGDYDWEQVFRNFGGIELSDE